ncbi:MAG TPA: NAD(P)H-binding protein, partial [Rubrobacter sp.]|nr:NAD(P)H-binding protein [Rubrobacter sp.]
MRILLTGATGLLGGELLKLLLAEGHEIRCLLRRDSPNASRLDGVETFRGDAAEEEAVYRALGGADALLHVAGIEYSPGVLAASRRAGVERVVVVGSTSVHSAYAFRAGPKLRMEELVRGSGLAWTIVRPSMIYGSERDRNVHRLLRFLDRSPVFPIFGPGTNLWQPVFHEDCARRTRSPETPIVRTPQLRPAWSRTPCVSRHGENGGRGPGQESTHRQAADRTSA